MEYLMDFSWKEFHQSPDYCPAFVKNNWRFASDIPTSTVSDTDKEEHTLLHFAVFGLRVKDVADLLARGADVNAESTYGFKPHHMLMTSILMSDASCPTTKHNIITILTMLIEHGAVDTPVFEHGIDDVTIVNFTTYMDNVPVVMRKTNAFGVTDLIRSIPVH